MGLLTNISLFSGAGGLDLGAKLVGGFRTVCYVEWDRYAQAVLMSRMRDGGLDEAPLWDDVSSFDGSEWRGCVDVISGGFPCQDLSGCARPGEQRKGIVEGERSGLWKEFARIVGEVGPRFVIVENVPGLLLDGGLGVVLGDLADLGLDAQWFCLPAAATGAPHNRNRLWVVAYAKGESCSNCDGIMPGQKQGKPGRSCCVKWRIWDAEPRVGRVANGLGNQLDRLRLLGNGVVPQQAATAWQMIKDMSEEHER